MKTPESFRLIVVLCFVTLLLSACGASTGLSVGFRILHKVIMSDADGTLDTGRTVGEK